MRDLKNNIDVVSSLAPAGNRTASSNGASADLRGYEGAVVTFVSGTITDGTHTPKVQESDDDSTYTDVAAADQLGTLATIAANAVQRVGYIGAKRYIRAVVTAAGTTTGGMYIAAIVRGKPAAAPLA
ncbi:MAG: hypothetical protein ACT4P2_13740 [Pseudomonadota bacterium]